MEVDKMVSAGEPEETNNSGHAQKTAYKSMKKKYRKMKYRFDAQMSLNIRYYREEARAQETARRLALENDQILDLLMDVNNSPQIPPHLRIDIETESPALSALPGLISSDPVECPTPEGQAVYDNIRTLLDDQIARKNNIPTPPKSLAQLLAIMPPLPLSALSATQISDLTIPQPVAYLAPSQIDEHLTRIDIALGLEVPASMVAAANTTPPHLSAKELEVRNPNSVYNWLRLHEPQVFLQDGEDISLSATAKAGSLRGAGKRASVAAPSKYGAVEFVEEDGIGYDPSMPPNAAASLGSLGKGGKRKRASDEDVGYRPKGGSNKLKKKKKEGDAEGGSRKSIGTPKVKVKSEGGVGTSSSKKAKTSEKTTDKE